MQESRATQIGLPTRLCEKPPDRPSPPVEAAFGIDIEYAVLQKIYASTQSKETVQSGRLHRLRRAGDRRIAESEAHLHQLRGAAEPHNADACAALRV